MTFLNKGNPAVKLELKIALFTVKVAPIVTNTGGSKGLFSGKPVQ